MGFFDKPFENDENFDFDFEFGKIAKREEDGINLDDFESDAAVLAATAAILEAEATVAKYETERDSAKTEYDELTAQRKELERQLSELAAKQEKARQKFFDVREYIRRSERQVEEKKAAKQVAMDAVKQRKKQQEATYEFEHMRNQFYWGDKIKDYQWTGAKFLATAERAILGDGMGLGKTLTTIASLDLVKSKKALVIAQTDITTNFDREIRKWAPHRNVVNIKGMSKSERTTVLEIMVPMMDHVIVIVNFEAWRKDFQLLAQLTNVGFDTVIIDEAHNLKGTDTLQYRGVRAICHAENKCARCGVLMPALEQGGNKVVFSNPQAGITFPQRKCVECGWEGQSIPSMSQADELTIWQSSRSVKNIWEATGTPILNHIEDLFALLNLIDPLNFRRKNAFLREYGQQGYDGKWGFRSGGADSLLNHRLNGKYLARNYKDAGIEIPPQDIIFHDMDLIEEEYPGQFEVIQQLQDHAQIVLNNGANLPAMVHIALLTRLRQANVWPGGITWTVVDPNTGQETLVRVSEEVQDSIKIDKAIQIAAEAIDEGRRVVVFSQFKQALVEFENRAQKFMTENNNEIKPIRFDGSTSDANKSKIKIEWDKSTGVEPEHNLLLANYKVGGTGLNLTEATVTIILDSEWNPGKRDQAYARNHRMGQDENTIVHVLRVNKTVDAWLDSLMNAKEDLINGFTMSASEMQKAYLEAVKNGELGI